MLTADTIGGLTLSVGYGEVANHFFGARHGDNIARSSPFGSGNWTALDIEIDGLSMAKQFSPPIFTSPFCNCSPEANQINEGPDAQSAMFLLVCRNVLGISCANI